MDAIGDQPMGFSVDPDRGLGVWCLDQAEDLAALLIHPIFEVVDPVLVLVWTSAEWAWATSLAVAPSGRLSCTSMHIHEQRHHRPPSVAVRTLSVTTASGRVQPPTLVLSSTCRPPRWRSRHLAGLPSPAIRQHSHPSLQ